MDIDYIIKLMPEEERKEIKDYLKSLDDDALKIRGIDSKEKAIDFMDKNDHFLKAKDSIISKAVESFRNNHYQIDLDKAKSEIEEKVRAELNPKETEVEKQLRELRERELERARLDEYRTRKELSMLDLYAKEIPLTLAEVVVANNDEKTKLNIELLHETISTYKKEILELKQQLNIATATTGTPKTGTTDFAGIKNPFVPDEKGNQNLALQSKLWNEDRDLYNKFLAEARQSKSGQH